LIVRRLVNFAQEKVRTVERRKAVNDLFTRFLPPSPPLSPQGANLLEGLRQHGNVLLPALADGAALEALRAALAQRPCYDPWTPELADFALEHTPPGTNSARIRDVSRLEAARALANHPLVLEVVAGYLGCKPTIDDIVAWWSVPGRAAPREEQFFHRDTDAVGFVKLFIYLADVAEGDGAHIFVNGSHRENTLLQRRRRYTDEEVRALYPAPRVCPIVGSFGTAFLEDTFGLHKGTVPQLRPRLIFQVRYTTFPGVFGRALAVRRPAGPYDPYVNRLIA
jgi:hypothetical protein